MANNENISKILGLTPMIPEESSQEVIVPGQSNNSIANQDFDYARKNLKKIIDDGSVALTDMIDFANQSQHPRTYEVVATMIEKLVTANKELLALSKQIKDIENKDKTTNDPTVTNNNLFVGSTAALQKLLRGEDT